MHNLQKNELLSQDNRGGRSLNFEQAWRDILRIVDEKQRVETLTRKVVNEIISTTLSEITLRSEQTGNDRIIRKNDVRPFWNMLVKKGTLNFMEDLPETKWRHIGAIIIALLAELPYVKYKTMPRTLYLD